MGQVVIQNAGELTQKIHALEAEVQELRAAKRSRLCASCDNKDSTISDLKSALDDEKRECRELKAQVNELNKQLQEAQPLPGEVMVLERGEVVRRRMCPALSGRTSELPLTEDGFVIGRGAVTHCVQGGRLPRMVEPWGTGLMPGRHWARPANIGAKVNAARTLVVQAGAA